MFEAILSHFDWTVALMVLGLLVCLFAIFLYVRLRNH
jgi:sugar phosphate permease